MFNLIRADLFRILKSKLTIVAVILSCAFPLLISLLFYGLFKLLGLEGDDFLGNLIGKETVIQSVFSVSNDIGLIVPIFSAILVCFDINNGSLRNKVVVGKSRVSIYLSHLICSIMFNVVMIILYASLSLLFSNLFFGFDKDIGREVVIKYIYWFVTGVFTFAFIATFTTFLALFVKSIPLSIIFTILFGFFLSLLNTIIGFLDYKGYEALVYLIPTFSNNIGITNLTFQEVSMNLQIFLEGIGSYLLFGLINTIIGMIIFLKRDLK